MNAALLLVWLALPARAGVEAALDPRVELAAALELLGSTAAPRAFLAAGPYAQALRAGTASCAAHPAVAAYARLRRDARVDWPAQALVALTACLDDALEVVSGDECRRSALAASAADFARACSFLKTLDAARPHAEPALKALRAEALRADVADRARAYAGLEPGAMRVAASPLLEPGRFWNGVVRGPGSFSVIRVQSPEPGTPARYAWKGVPLELWHETGHGLLDPLMPVTSPPPGVGPDCYETWERCAREHMAQGFALRLARAAGQAPRVNPHLPRLETVSAALAEYEKDRARWPTLRDFHPRWLQSLGAGPAAASSSTVAAPEAAPDPRLAAALARAARDPQGAEKDLRRLSEERPDDGAVLLSLAVLRRSRDKAEGLALAGRAVAAAREREGGAWLLPDALSTRASWRREDGDFIGARVDLEEALAAAPLDWPRREEARAALAAPRR